MNWLKEFDVYLDELVEWNKKFNLTAITDPQEIKVKHFEDSLTLSDAYDFSKEDISVLDIGTGAGFPGIPLKMVFPNIKLTLLDSVKKKTEFLKHIIEKLKLDGVKIVWARAEDFATDNRGKYDAVVCRALAPLAVASELCLPFVKIGGVFLAMKGKNIDNEIAEGKNAITVLGGEIMRVVSVAIGGGNGKIERDIVVIGKKNPTPREYPRKAGIPKKRPL